jgi:excisionase family DNA binding protein
MPIQLRRLAAPQQVAEFASTALNTLAAEVSAAPVAMGPAQAAHLPGTPFLSLREAGDWLCVSLSTMNRMIAKGDLATVRVGKHRKVPASYLAAYVAKDILLPEQVADITQAGV